MTNKKEDTNHSISTKEIEGIGGWLRIIGIGVMLSPILAIYTLYQTYFPAITDGTFNTIISSSSEQYTHILYFTIIEIIINLLLTAALFYQLYLFFMQKSLFPKFFIWMIIINLIFIVTDAYLAHLILPNVELFDEETKSEIRRIVYEGIIWIPYMIRSKRVKNTFIY
jgi:hypothetical protein